jgi:hypothetical protein
MVNKYKAMFSLCKVPYNILRIYKFLPLWADSMKFYVPVLVVLALFAAAVASEVLVLHDPELLSVVEPKTGLAG